MASYLFYYIFVALIIGFILGSGFGGLGGYLAQGYSNISFINQLITEMAELIESFNLSLKVNGTLGSAIDLGISGTTTREINLNSSINISSADSSLGLLGQLSGDTYNFYNSFKFNALVEQADGLRYYWVDAAELEKFLQENKNFKLDVISGIIGGGLVGSVNGLLCGLLLGFILSILDFGLLRIALTDTKRGLEASTEINSGSEESAKNKP